MTSNKPTEDKAQAHTPTIEELSQFMGLDAEHVHSSIESDVTRDPITGRVVRGGDGTDASLGVAFTREAVYSKLESFRADSTGRTPKYVDQDFITITVPGDRSTMIHTHVTEHHKWRFPIEYRLFIDGQKSRQTGTPLHYWTELSPALIKELEYHSVTTVEQIASLSDSTNGIIAGFSKLREGAKRFLSKSTDEQRDSALKAELDKRDAELAEMRTQLAELAAAQKAAAPSKTAK